MTALRPTETSRVRGVSSETYKSNLICAHPECSELVQLRPSGEPTVHHIFPRSLIKSDSYFVEITDESDGSGITHSTIVPHAVGLCGSGTTGHHGDVEEHRAWIRLEDGVFVWYERVKVSMRPHSESDDPWVDQWISFGPLNPQPGSVEGKPKKKKKSGEEKRKRKTISLRVPADSEDGAAVYDEYLGRVKERLVVEGLYVSIEKIPAYEATIAAWDDWLNS